MSNDLTVKQNIEINGIVYTEDEACDNQDIFGYAESTIGNVILICRSLIEYEKTINFDINELDIDCVKKLKEKIKSLKKEDKNLRWHERNKNIEIIEFYVDKIKKYNNLMNDAKNLLLQTP